VLSAAGLLPAALLNIDVPRILQGAANVRRLCLKGAAEEDWPAQLGLCAAEMLAAGKSSIVFMPYSARLRAAADWFVQLWDESLGKQGKGQAVIAAEGPADQHAQMQLFLDGPDDKLLLFVRLAHHENELRLGDFEWEAFGAGYLKGRTLGEVIDAQWRGTVQACVEAGRPSLTLTLPKLDAEVMGELLMGLQVATSIAALQLGVNAYDQPAVERGKQASRKLLGGA
jgi:glucose-6-phosphate isomerase